MDALEAAGVQSICEAFARVGLALHAWEYTNAWYLSTVNQLPAVGLFQSDAGSACDEDSISHLSRSCHVHHKCTQHHQFCVQLRTVGKANFSAALWCSSPEHPALRHQTITLSRCQVGLLLRGRVQHRVRTLVYRARNSPSIRRLL